MSSTLKWSLLLAGACSVCATAGAQPPTPPTPPEDRVLFLQNVAPLPVFGGSIEVLGGGGGIAGPVVKGKPYSARSITESTQALADGNRIVQRNESVFYRDSEGRTRREQTLGGVGPWAAAGEPATIINLYDPVADKSYMLDPDARVAREIRPFRMAFAQAEGIETVSGAVGAGTAEVRRVFSAAVPAPIPGGSGVVTAVRGITVEENVTVAAGGNVAAAGTVAFAPSLNAAMGAYAEGEDLGEQVLEGLLVQGTRMRDTIPAGAMGNERPIEIVTERWYSKDIDAMVLQRFSDPRFGETVYRLVNVVLGDPSEDLFQVPQGYELRSAEEAAAMRGVGPLPGRRFEVELRGEPGALPPPPPP